ncbi:uncharacterized protein (DUF302 family) [Aliiruegeria haliotis]|uniref:Uncharacterized protein (DUF302 family) n=1 Tax=Aliiruegeria haliotis TaxID=1280846 RepID=A0A2T0RJY5_9RHOB|nr:DUF302 domain-containing protein [Aliiruegeria haliotis]PRY21493.1 uncharacterized protein (DUF302 family) [Aliiruegeria haliotis]
MISRHMIALCALLLPAPLQAESNQDAVDASFERVATEVATLGLDPVASIDHARLAAQEGVEMPPSRVQIFSDAAVDSAILAAEIRAGLDLPYRILSFDAAGSVAIRATGSEFLQLRHGLPDIPALETWETTLETILAAQADLSAAAPVAGLGKDDGIIELDSPYDLAETVQRLRDTILAEGDTVWFGEHDFQARAATNGVELPGATLLLFGGPAPGGVAMADFPSIGLDAFCQKLFLHETEDGGVKVLFNGIAALAELHYGHSAEPHRQLDARLAETFSRALEK